MMEINRELFSIGQLEVIDERLKHGEDVSIFADPKFTREQMIEIAYGVSWGLDTSFYADPNFSSAQMSHIMWGLYKGFDVSIYAHPKFRDEQMAKIRDGLEKGVDASIYARPELPYDAMDNILTLLMARDNQKENKKKIAEIIKHYGWRSKKMKVKDLEISLNSIVEAASSGANMEAIKCELEHNLAYITRKIAREVDMEKAIKPFSEEEREEYEDYDYTDMPLNALYGNVSAGLYKGRGLVFIKNEIEAILNCIYRLDNIKAEEEEALKEFTKEEKAKIKTVLKMPLEVIGRFHRYIVYDEVDISILKAKKEAVLKFAYKKIELTALEDEVLKAYRDR